MAVVNGTKLNDALIGTVADDQIFGIDGNDTLLGLDGNNTLDGGKGADFMQGGGGTDIFIVDNIGDIVRDTGGQDRVEASISYSLLLVPDIEHLFLTGKAAINGIGNDSINTIAGNGAANKLDGGNGNDSLFGGAGNDTIVGGSGNDSMFGNAGNDTFYVDSTADSVDGSTGIDTVISSAPAFTILGDTENLTLVAGISPHPSSQNGEGNDLNNRIIGSGLNNFLNGRVGNDTLMGGDGNDTLNGGGIGLGGDGGADLMIGGAGNDTYELADKGDVAQESIAGSAGGIDTVIYFGTTPFVLGANIELADVQAANLATGNALDNSITGATAFSSTGVKLLGLAGNDTLQAFGTGNHTLDGGSGADLMAGSNGNDLFFLDNGSDFAIGGAGIDEIRTSLSVLQEFGDIENYTFTGGAVSFAANGLGDNTLKGSKYADTLICDFGNDVLFGGGGNDTLWGGTGSDFLSGDGGADRMNGGTGDDSYEVDNAKDVIDELVSGNEGKDTIVTHISLSLAGSTILGDVENLLLSAIGTAVNGAGNALDNFIMGNSANNKLDGGGGADTLNGMSGNDTLTIDALDAVSGGAGVDTVIATASVNLSFAVDIENYILAQGAGAISIFTSDNRDTITGNESGNTIFARGDNDTVDGGLGDDTINGGFGDDAIIGGGGNDLIVGGPGANKINVSAGNDTVQSGFIGIAAHDLISGFDGNAAGGQDFVSLTALFDDLGIGAGDRINHVNVVDKGSVVEIRVDANAVLGGDGTFELLVATLQTNDSIIKGVDVLL